MPTTNTRKDDATMQEQKSIFPANSVYYSDTNSTIWISISFGSYPQTEVTEETLTSKITGSCYDQTAVIYL